MHTPTEWPALAGGAEGRQRCQYLAQHQFDPAPNGLDAVTVLDLQRHRHGNLPIDGRDDVELGRHQSPRIQPFTHGAQQRCVGQRCVGVQRVARGPDHHGHHTGCRGAARARVKARQAFGAADLHTGCLQGDFRKVAGRDCTVVAAKFTRQPRQCFGHTFCVCAAQRRQRVADLGTRHRRQFVDGPHCHVARCAATEAIPAHADALAPLRHTAARAFAKAHQAGFGVQRVVRRLTLAAVEVVNPCPA